MCAHVCAHSCVVRARRAHARMRMFVYVCVCGSRRCTVVAVKGFVVSESLSGVMCVATCPFTCSFHETYMRFMIPKIIYDYPRSPVHCDEARMLHIQMVLGHPSGITLNTG